MSEAIQAYPLQWPIGQRRTESFARHRGNFGKTQFQSYATGGGYNRKRELTITDGVERVLATLGRMGVHREDVVISTNVRTRLDGLPYSNSAQPADPGAAVYWRKKGQTRCMAIDRYDRVQDNLAAISGTLEAIRTAERYGNAGILDQIFQGLRRAAGAVFMVARARAQRPERYARTDRRRSSPAHHEAPSRPRRH